MAKVKKKESLILEEQLEAAFVPEKEQPYSVPRNWCWIQLGTYIDFATDYVANGSFASLKKNVTYYKEENYAILVKTQDFSNNFTEGLTYTDKHGYNFLKKSVLYGGELILSNTGSIGKVFRVPHLNKPMTLAPNSIMIKCYRETDYDLLYYYFLSPFGTDQLHSITTGTAVKKFNKTDLKTICLPLPPLSEQQRIVELIESLFTKLDDAKQKVLDALESFETRKAAILHKAFTGELTAQWRKEHGLGMESWQTKKLSEVSRLQTGIMKGKHYAGQTIMLPYLRVANVQDGFLSLDEIKEIEVAPEQVERYSLVNGDVLFTEGGDYNKLGRGTVWQGQIKNCLHQNHVFVVRPHTDVLNPYFLSYQAGSRYGKQYFLRCSKQTTNLASINSTQLKAFPLLMPTIEEQVQIVLHIDDLLAKEQEAKEVAQRVLEQIGLIKKAILARAFRGELGTNNPSEENAVELVKEVIERKRCFYENT